MYLEQGTVPCSARTYTYDKRGNITSAKTYKYNTGDLSDQTPTKSYTCTYKSGDDVWEDELVNATAIDENSSLLYDENGNPINYYGAKIKWSAGRQLSKISGVDEDGNEEAYAAFTYDENGIRTSEQSIEDSLTFDFTTEDGAITGRQSADGKNYRFIYDESGKPTAFLMNGALYHYVTNQMGDVIGVADADGNLALEYYYDAWGDSFTARPNSCDYDGKSGWNGAYRLYNDNPIKYRGYYFDHAIGLYYLQSRYFHTDINRFFNADDPDMARESKDVPVGMNLFAYCNNDPVNNVDPTGQVAITFSVAAGVILASAIAILVSIVLADSALKSAVNGMPKSLFPGIGGSIKKRVEYMVTWFTLTKAGMKSVINDIKARTKRNKKSKGTQIHHIVPKNVKLTIVKASKGHRGYEVLVKQWYVDAGLDIESHHNKIKLKSRFHRALNTNAYYSMVYYITGAAYNKSNKKGVRKTTVLISVLYIKAILRAMNAQSPS